MAGNQSRRNRLPTSLVRPRKGQGSEVLLPGYEYFQTGPDGTNALCSKFPRLLLGSRYIQNLARIQGSRY